MFYSCIEVELKLPVFFLLFEGTVYLYVTGTCISFFVLVYVWAGKGQLYIVGS